MYGKLTVGAGTDEQRDINIVEFVRAKFKDDRTITVSLLEDGSYYLLIENAESTGRLTKSKQWLSKESFIGLIASTMLYLEIKGEDIENLIKESANGDKVDYQLSDNLEKHFEK